MTKIFPIAIAFALFLVLIPNFFAKAADNDQLLREAQVRRGNLIAARLEADDKAAQVTDFANKRPYLLEAERINNEIKDVMDRIAYYKKAIGAEEIKNMGQSMACLGRSRSSCVNDIDRLEREIASNTKTMEDLGKRLKIAPDPTLDEVYAELGKETLKLQRLLREAREELRYMNRIVNLKMGPERVAERQAKQARFSLVDELQAQRRDLKLQLELEGQSLNPNKELIKDLRRAFQDTDADIRKISPSIVEAEAQKTKALNEAIEFARKRGDLEAVERLDGELKKLTRVQGAEEKLLMTEEQIGASKLRKDIRRGKVVPRDWETVKFSDFEIDLAPKLRPPRTTPRPTIPEPALKICRQPGRGGFGSFLGCYMVVSSAVAGFENDRKMKEINEFYAKCVNKGIEDNGGLINISVDNLEDIIKRCQKEAARQMAPTTADYYLFTGGIGALEDLWNKHEENPRYIDQKELFFTELLKRAYTKEELDQVEEQLKRMLADPRIDVRTKRDMLERFRRTRQSLDDLTRILPK